MIKYRNSYISSLMQIVSLQVSSTSYNSPYTYLRDMITSFFQSHYNSKYEIDNILNYVDLQVINNTNSEKFKYILIQLRKIN
jgi:hypothetical protein